MYYFDSNSSYGDENNQYQQEPDTRPWFIDSQRDQVFVDLTESNKEKKAKKYLEVRVSSSREAIQMKPLPSYLKSNNLKYIDWYGEFNPKNMLIIIFYSFN